MKITATIFVGIFLVGSSVWYAETHSFTKTIESGATALESWIAGDHLGAAKRYEGEARLLEAEVRGMEQVEMKVLPFLEVEAITEAGVQKLIDRRRKEGEKNMKLATCHHQAAMQSLAEKEANLLATHSQKAVMTGICETLSASNMTGSRNRRWAGQSVWPKRSETWGLSSP